MAIKKAATKKTAASAAKAGKTIEAPKSSKKPMSERLRDKREKLYPGKNFREGGAPKEKASAAGKALHWFDKDQQSGSACAKAGLVTRVTGHVTCKRCLRVMTARGMVVLPAPMPEPSTYVGADTELQPCGHPAAAVTGSDEGTQYCNACADEAPPALPGDVPPPTGKQQRIAGFSVAQLCRWMGREGFSEREARAALEAKGIVLVGNAVRSSLGAGRPASPRYDAAAIPELPAALANDLRAVLSPKEAAVA